LDQLPPRARLCAKTLLEQLNLLPELRPKAKTAMIVEAKKHPGRKPTLLVRAGEALQGREV
jgi:hypothetical protein